jgi:hypothetical protein
MSTTYRHRYRRQPGAAGPETIVLDRFDDDSPEVIDYHGWYFDIQRCERIAIIGSYRRIA